MIYDKDSTCTASSYDLENADFFSIPEEAINAYSIKASFLCNHKKSE